MSLGQLKGNRFTIIVRDAKKPCDIKRIPNFFDEQRFSKNSTLNSGATMCPKVNIKLKFLPDLVPR